MGLISLDVSLSSECQAPALHGKHFTVHALYAMESTLHAALHYYSFIQWVYYFAPNLRTNPLWLSKAEFHSTGSNYTDATASI